jgi:hypothetical protein
MLHAILHFKKKDYERNERTAGLRGSCLAGMLKGFRLTEP